MQITWSIEGQTQLSRVLLGMTSHLKDYKTPLKSSAKKLVSIYSGEVFTTEGAVINEQWKRLSPRTVAQKARSGFGDAGLLQRTGTMKRSFKSVVSSTQAVISNDADYFKYHQSNKDRHLIPRRVMMKLADPQKEMVVREFQKYLRESMIKH